MAYDRKADPNNLEELMISEYYRHVEENKTLKNQLENEKRVAKAHHDEMQELLEAEEAKSAELQSIIDRDTGVVDLHKPILLYKSDIAGDYYFKDWLNDHADDVGELEGLSGYINALNANDAGCIAWFKNHGNRSYSTLVKTEQHEFKFTLQVPVFGIYAYDPEYNKTQLIVPNTEYADERWVNMPLERFTKCVAAKIREVANVAYRKYRAEVEKAEAKKEENDG